MVRKIKKGMASKPEYMNKVLGLFPEGEGVQCASSVFSHKLDIFQRSNEIEIGSCKVACNGCKWTFVIMGLFCVSYIPLLSYFGRTSLGICGPFGILNVSLYSGYRI